MSLLGRDLPPGPALRRSLVVGVVLAAALVAAPALPGAFVGDDHAAVAGNPCVTGPFSVRQLLATNFWGRPPTDPAISTWRPFTVLAWWPLWRLGGGTPWPFHALNLVLHVVCTLLLLRLGLALRLPPRAALLGAAAFAVAAVHMDAVANVVNAADLWALAFTLAGALAILRGSAWCVPAALLAALAKESGLVAVPLYLTLIWAGPAAPRRPGGRRLALLVGGAAAVTIGALVARGLLMGGLAIRGVSFELNPLLGRPFWQRIPAAADVLGRYQSLMLLGHPLSGTYSYAAVPVGPDADSLWVGLGGVAIAAWLGALLRLRRAPAARALVLWFLGACFLVSNLPVLLPVVLAERFFYLASAPLALLLGLGLDRLLGDRRRWLRLGVAAGAALWLAAQAGLAARHAWAWGDWGRLTAVTAANAPGSARGRYWRGRWLVEHGRGHEARAHFEAALATFARLRSGQEPAPPDTAQQLLGNIYASYGVALDLDGEPQQALQSFLAAMRVAARDPATNDLFVQFLLKHGHRQEAERVRAALHGPPRPTRSAP